MRPPVIVAVAMLVLVLIGFVVWEYTSPFPLSVPKDRILIELFQAHRQTFETLTEMAEKDAMIASNSTSESLSISRRSEYSRLLSQIDSKMQMGLIRLGLHFRPPMAAFFCQLDRAGRKGLCT
jgi:hypothetical protein